MEWTLKITRPVELIWKRLQHMSSLRMNKPVTGTYSNPRALVLSPKIWLTQCVYLLATKICRRWLDVMVKNKWLERHKIPPHQNSPPLSSIHSFPTFSFTFSSSSSALSDAVRTFSWRLSTGLFSHCQPTSANWSSANGSSVFWSELSKLKPCKLKLCKLKLCKLKNQCMLKTLSSGDWDVATTFYIF